MVFLTSNAVGYINKLSNENRLSDVTTTCTQEYDNSRKCENILKYPYTGYDSYASISVVSCNQFIMHEFKTPIFATHYSFEPFSSSIYQRNWRVETSNNGDDWVLQDNHTNDDILNCGKELLFNLKKPDKYKYFKFVNTGKSSYSSPYILYSRRFDIMNIKNSIDRYCLTKKISYSRSFNHIFFVQLIRFSS